VSRATCWIVAAALLSAATSCSRMHISTEYDHNADFGRLRTYGWLTERVPVTDPRVDREFLDATIHAAVDAKLAEKGYTLVSGGKADFLVGYHADIERKTDFDSLNSYYGYGPGLGWQDDQGRRPMAGSDVDYTFEYDEGSLVLDVVGTESRRLLWRATANADVDLSAPKEKRRARLTEAVRKLLARFPPR
jgi:hypothetical protein